MCSSIVTKCLQVNASHFFSELSYMSMLTLPSVLKVTDIRTASDIFQTIDSLLYMLLAK